MDELMAELWKRDVASFLLEKDLNPDELGSNGRAAMFELFKRSMGYHDGVIWESCSSIYDSWPESYHEMLEIINDNFPLKYFIPHGKRKIIIPCTTQFISSLSNCIPEQHYSVRNINIYGLLVGDNDVPMLVCFEAVSCANLDSARKSDHPTSEFFFPTKVIDPDDLDVFQSTKPD